MQICKEIKKCKKHKNYKKMNLKFGRRYRSSFLLLLTKIYLSKSIQVTAQNDTQTSSYVESHHTT